MTLVLNVSYFLSLSPLGLSYTSSTEVPGLVRPISTTVPLQFNNNNSVHVVNTSLPVYSLPSNYGLNLSSKSAEAKPDVKDVGKAGFDHAAGHQNATNSSTKKLKFRVKFLHCIRKKLVIT